MYISNIKLVKIVDTGIGMQLIYNTEKLFLCNKMLAVMFRTTTDQN